MKKIVFLILMVLIAVSINAEKKKLLILDSQSQEPYKTLRESMIEELKKLGYESGKNLKIDYEIVGNFEGRAYNILKVKADQYDVIFINGTVAAQGAVEFIDKRSKKESYNFVFANVTDPVGLGLVDKIGEISNTRFTGVAYPVKVEERLRFITKIFGSSVKIGYIYADMPQSKAYNIWLNEALKRDEFKNIKLVAKKVEFVKGDEGHRRMVQLAKEGVIALDKSVDIFMSPNDQMGISDEFSTMVNKTATKPLVGMANETGICISLASDMEQNGKEVAKMIKMILDGKEINRIISENSEVKLYYDELLIKKFKIESNKIKKFKK